MSFRMASTYEKVGFVVGGVIVRRSFCLQFIPIPSSPAFTSPPCLAPLSLQQVLDAANSERLLNTYFLMKEHTRVAVAAPVPICIILMVFEIIGYLRRMSLLRKRYPDSSTGRRIDLYLSRNTPIEAPKLEEEVDTKNKNMSLAISACMERARSQVLASEKEEQESAGSRYNHVLEEIKSKVADESKVVERYLSRVFQPNPEGSFSRSASGAAAIGVRPSSQSLVPTGYFGDATANQSLARHGQQNYPASEPPTHQSGGASDKVVTEQMVEAFKALHGELRRKDEELSTARQEIRWEAASSGIILGSKEGCLPAYVEHYSSTLFVHKSITKRLQL